MTDLHHHHHGHVHVNDRQQREAAVYDARAQELAAIPDEQLRLDPAVPPYPNREHVDFLDYAFDQLGPLTGRRVLEVGCGSGTLAVWLAMQGAAVTGLDVSAEMLELARRRARVNGVEDRCTFLLQPVESYDAPAGSFDLALGNQTLHHLELPEAMSNLARLLGDGGRAVFCEPVLFVPEPLRRLRNSRAVTRVFSSKADTPDERSLGVQEVDLIRRHFAASDARPFQLTTRLQNFVPLSDRWFSRLSRLDQSLLGHRLPDRLCRYLVITLSTTTTTADHAQGAAA